MSQRIIFQNLIICTLYGLLSLFQTLNSRALYKDLHFDFYSFVTILSIQTFALQRIIIIIIFMFTSET